jgi:hypothetical protein
MPHSKLKCKDISLCPEHVLASECPALHYSNTMLSLALVLALHRTSDASSTNLHVTIVLLFFAGQS